MNRAENMRPRQRPPIVSVVVLLLFTLAAGLCSAFTVYITYLHFSTPKGWTVCAMSVGSVWFFVGCCWFRIFVEQTPPAMPDQEQLEGVWPPAPRLSPHRENGEGRNG